MARRRIDTVETVDIYRFQSAGRRFEIILVDGFVHLEAPRLRGLGARLAAALPYRAAVIGIAKNPLKTADRYVPVTRGRSRRPLYVSSVGMALDRAAARVAAMHGPYRIPTLVRATDRLARAAGARIR